MAMLALPRHSLLALDSYTIVPKLGGLKTQAFLLKSHRFPIKSTGKCSSARLGGFKHVLFSPRKWGKWSNLTKFSFRWVERNYQPFGIRIHPGLIRHHQDDKFLPRKLTWTQKMMLWKRNFLLKWSLFRGFSFLGVYTFLRQPGDSIR